MLALSVCVRVCVCVRVAAGGDDLKAGLLPRELCVMAGLDPASSLTRSLVEALLQRKHPHTGRIDFDSFLKVALHFRDSVSGCKCLLAGLCSRCVHLSSQVPGPLWRAATFSPTLFFTPRPHALS